MLAITKNRKLLVAGALVASLLLYLAARHVDPVILIKTLKQSNWWYCLVIMLAQYIYLYIKAFRWRLLLADQYHGSSSGLLSPTVIGYAGNLLIPHMGELVRVGYLKKYHRIPGSYTLMGIGVERAFDMITLPILLVVPIAFASDINPEIRSAAIALLLTGASVFLVVLSFRSGSERVSSILGKCLPRRFGDRVINVIRNGSKAVANLHSKRTLLKVTVLSVLQWFFVAICVYCSLLALDIELPFWVSLSVLGVLIAALVLPTAPGYVGTIQFAFVVTLGHFQVADETALAASVFYNLWITIPAVIWALLISRSELFSPSLDNGNRHAEVQ